MPFRSSAVGNLSGNFIGTIFTKCFTFQSRAHISGMFFTIIGSFTYFCKIIKQIKNLSNTILCFTPIILVTSSLKPRFSSVFLSHQGLPAKGFTRVTNNSLLGLNDGSTWSGCLQTCCWSSKPEVAIVSSLSCLNPFGIQTTFYTVFNNLSEFNIPRAFPAYF